MLIKIDKLKVDVLDGGCKDRPCFQLGFDQGSYSQGRGYTSYYKDSKGRRIQKPVCWTRHMRDCPVNSVCPLCNTASVEDPGSKCNSWGWSDDHSVPCEGMTEKPNSPSGIDNEN